MIKKSVGTQLRNGREAKRFSLDDLEALTGIKSSYLLSMEMDQFALLPSKAYEISYLKKYSQAVDLDHEAILRDYHIAVAEKQERLEQDKKAPVEITKTNDLSYSRAQATRHVTSHRQTKQMSSGYFKGLWLFMIALLLIISATAALFIFQNKQAFIAKNNSDQAALSSSEASSSQEASSSSSQSPSISLTPSVDGVTLTAQLSQANKPVDLVFTLANDALENWFAVSNSNYESGAILNQEYPTLRVALPQDVLETVITVGDPSSVTVTVNGEELDLSSLQAYTTSYITLRIE